MTSINFTCSFGSCCSFALGCPSCPCCSFALGCSCSFALGCSCCSFALGCSVTCFWSFAGLLLGALVLFANLDQHWQARHVVVLPQQVLLGDTDPHAEAGARGLHLGLHVPSGLHDEPWSARALGADALSQNG
eukprot:9498296-Pyramimonas_sp.AAC.3